MQKPILVDAVPSVDDSSYTQSLTAIEAARPETGFSVSLPDSQRGGTEIDSVVTVVQEPPPLSLLAEPSPFSAYPPPADATADDLDIAELLLSLGQLTISVFPPTPPLSETTQDPVGYTSPRLTSVITIPPLTSRVPERVSNVKRTFNPIPILPSHSELSLMLANNPWNLPPTPSPFSRPSAGAHRFPTTPTAVRLFHPYTRLPVGNGARRRMDDPFEMAIPLAVQLSRGFLSPTDISGKSRSRRIPRADTERWTPKRAENARLSVGRMDIQPITPPVIRHTRIVTQAWGTRSPLSVSTIHRSLSQPDTNNVSKEFLYPSPATMSSCPWTPVAALLSPIALDDRRTCETTGRLRKLEVSLCLSRCATYLQICTPGSYPDTSLTEPTPPAP